MRWPGFADAGTLVLPLPRAQRPSRALVLDGVAFEPKREHHVTVLGRTLGARVRDAIAQRSVAERELADAFEALDWSWADTDAYVWLRRNKPEGRAESIVELIDMPAMAAFHYALGRRLGERLPAPPAHVTRFVHGDPEGIGVPDEATLRALTVRLVAKDEVAHAL